MKRLAHYFLITALLTAQLIGIANIPRAQAAAGPNLIANPSVETVNPSSSNLPLNWSTDKWGTNTTTFTYKNDGHTGSRSVYVNTTKRTSGDAKWAFKAVNVQPNTSYTFTDYYKSNIATQLVAEYADSSGRLTYKTLLSPTASSTNWRQATVTLTTPSTTKQMTIFHLVNKVGWLQTDDAYLGLSSATTPAPPSVQITSPANNSTLSNTVALSANASDAQAVSNVQFKVDGNNLGAADTTAPYSFNWDTKQATNGTHTVSAVATNSAGLSATSTVNVTVQNTTPATPPSVSLSAPTNNSTVSGTTTVSANASDASGITSVQFKLDGNSLGSPDTTAPYSTSWNTTQTVNGAHVLTAVATNTSGLSTTSAAVNVTVQNTVAPPPVTDNLIANPSVETVDGANSQKPQKWLSSKWGTNTAAFTYVTNDGHTGSRSVKTQLTSFTSGDAKWYFEPVSIAGSKSYDYNHYYKSNVTTDVVAQFTNASGSNTYQWLDTLPASNTWQIFSASFNTPADATKVTILHVVYSVGWVQIDDTALNLTSPPVVDNGIPPNGSLETTVSNNPTLPSKWTKSSWGTNTPTFEYLNEGHTGSKSAKVTVTNYQDGDAKWYFDPITTLERGQQYRFSTWYKTNTTPHVVAMFNKADGTAKYFGLPNPQPDGTANWQSYSDTFSVPLDAQSVSVFMFISNNGWVQVDDQTITPYQPTGFNRALVSLTFDDGFEDNVATVLPKVNQYGIKTTHCYATQHVEGNQQGIDGVLAFKNSGHEVCSHTVSHPFLTQTNPTQLTYELQHSKQILENIIGAPVTDFASPYGDYSQAVNNEIKKFYRSHRTVDEGYNSKDNFDIYRLRVQNMFSTTTLAEFQSWLDHAEATNTWLILVYHRVANDPGTYDTYPADFDQQLQALVQSGLTIKTYNDALDEVVPQL